MHLLAGRTLDRVLILDRQHLERLRVHREARINELSRSWALDQYAVHPSSVACGLMSPLQIRVRYFSGFPDGPPDLLSPSLPTPSSPAGRRS
jgi:hypothetical protein